MNRSFVFTSAIAIAAITLVPASLGAQERRNEGRREGGGRAVGQAAPRQERSQPAPRQERYQQPRTERYQQPRTERYQQPRTERYQQQPRSERYQAQPRGERYQQPVPRYNQGEPRYNQGERYQPRAVPRGSDRPSYQSPSYRYDGAPRAVPRPRYDDRNYRDYRDYRDYRNYRDYRDYRYSRPYWYSRPYYYSRPYVRPYAWAPYRPYYFSRPWYSFRPRISIGFGLWVGYAEPYPWTYLGSYRPRVYGYYPSYEVAPSTSIYGGVTFDIQPYDADVFVDGEYAGTVGTFSSTAEPLTLTAGTHRIAVQRDGFKAMEWEVTIEPGLVIPYRGEMERY